MEHTGNKLVFILIALLCNINQGFHLVDILPLLVALACSFGSDLVAQKGTILLCVGFYVLIFFIPNLIWYLPLLIYDSYDQDTPIWIYIPCLLCLISLFHNYLICVIVSIGIVLALIFKQRYLRILALLEVYKKQRDSTKELSILMEDRQHDLLEKQEYEIRLATVNERNRIAREIHDNVGHLLSSSLLQIGALTAINEQVQLSDPLNQVKTTLNEAMTSIRLSVHDLHDDTVDLAMEVKKLCSSFTFCECNCVYTIEHPMANDVSFHVLAIVKEALHNITKHSNATKVSVTLREQPKFYQLIIQDNGNKLTSSSDQGIGLLNMQARVDKCHGLFHYTNDHGFRIFITLPKQSSI